MAQNKVGNNRMLPVIEIAGTQFYVNVIDMELLEVTNTQNKVSVGDMITLEGHHEFLYDKQTKNVKKGSWHKRDDAVCEYIWIRRIESLDPEGMRIYQVSKGRSREINLPVVKIAGSDFYWDEKKVQFSQVDNIWNKIYKNDVTVEGKVQGFYFNTKNQYAVFPHEIDYYKSLPCMPQHIEFIDVSAILKNIKAEQSQTDNLLDKNRVAGNGHEIKRT